MALQERILNYISIYGKKDKYKLARALKIDVAQKQGRIEINEGKAMLVKEQPIEKLEEEPVETLHEKEQVEEQKTGEVSEKLVEEETEDNEQKIEEYFEEQKLEGTVKFYFGYQCKECIKKGRYGSLTRRAVNRRHAYKRENYAIS